MTDIHLFSNVHILCRFRLLVDICDEFFKLPERSMNVRDSDQRVDARRLFGVPGLLYGPAHKILKVLGILDVFNKTFICIGKLVSVHRRTPAVGNELSGVPRQVKEFSFWYIVVNLTRSLFLISQQSYAQEITLTDEMLVLIQPISFSAGGHDV
jgi:hypothetical protein